MKPLLPLGVGVDRGRGGPPAWNVQSDGFGRIAGYNRGGAIRAFIVSLLGAAALTVGILVLRHQKEMETVPKGRIPAGEKTARIASLERLRELGL